jgi:3-methyladenine DNA glycosylase Tag
MEKEEKNYYSSLWKSAIEFLKKKGYKDEIKYYKNIKPPKTMDEFLSEYAWVVFASGFKVKTLEMKWKGIERVFFNFNVEKIVQVVKKDPKYFYKIRMPINNKRKINAIVETAEIIKREGYKKFLDIEKMRELPFIGEVTKFHLARNLGLDVGKPDRWMIRLAKKLGFSPNENGVKDMLKKFQSATGEKIGVIDIVLWRACEQGWIKTLNF